MSVKTIAILMPGDMGHGCAIAFRENGFRVVTNLAERSERTKGLSAKAGLEDLGSFEEVASRSILFYPYCHRKRHWSKAAASRTR